MRRLILLVVLFSSLVFSHAAAQTPDTSDCLSGKLALHLAISPDGKQALSEPADLNEVWLWDVQSGKKIWSYQNNEDVYSNITTLAFSPNGKYFLMANSDKAIVWDRVTFEQVGVFPRLQRAYYTDADFLMDSEYLLVSGASEGVQLWEIKSQKLIHSFPGVTVAYLSPNEQYILVSQDEMSWDLWNIREGIKIHTFPVTITPHFTPDGKWVATSDLRSGLILTSIENPEITQPIPYDGENFTGWDFTADSKYIITTYKYGEYILIDIDTGKIVHTFTHFYPSNWHLGNDSILEIEYAKDPNTKTKIRSWDIDSFELIKAISIETGHVFNSNLTHDGKYLLTLSNKKEYVLTDLETFQVVSRFC
ncbi:MAG: hypothetical protein LCI00_19775 [Chloroflexi bacterium]|nr:hypothetical protein [Chloroflexota bacterium]MCC6891360.1 hypothetical protein [Anaerolineae bacterium]